MVGTPAASKGWGCVTEAEPKRATRKGNESCENFINLLDVLLNEEG